jgi:hypothetical protein
LQNRVRCEDLARKFGTMIKAILDAYQKEHKASVRRLAHKVNKRRVAASAAGLR